MKYHALQRIWQPPADTLGNLTAVLRSHWRTARLPGGMFWPSPMRWLTYQPIRVARAVTYQRTSGGRLIR